MSKYSLRKTCENLSDDIPSVCFVLLAHNLHVSELAFTRYHYASRLASLISKFKAQNKISSAVYQNRSPSPSPAPPQWASSPRPATKCLAFVGKFWNIISSEQSAKLWQSFLDSRWGASIYVGFPVHIIVRLILDTPGFFSFHFCKYLCTWSG